VPLTRASIHDWAANAWCRMAI